MDAVNCKALEDLKKYRKDGCHMLVPCMDQIAEVAAGFRLIVTQVFLRPHPKDKDVYPHDGVDYDTKANDWKKTVGQGQYQRKIEPEAELVRVSGQGLEKLAQHTALVWDKPHVMIDREHKGRQLCELAGAVRMPDGFSFYRLADAYGMDLDIVREQLQSQYKKDDQKWLIDRDLLQKKVNQTKLCISGARNRIIRKILGVDGTYTVASLGKPFIAVRVIPWLDMSDEYTRHLVTEMNVKQMAITSLFGGQMPEARQIEAPNNTPAISYEANIPPEKCNSEVINAEETTTTYHLDKSQTMEEDVPFSLAAEAAPTSAESLRADFENCDADGQAKTLTVMVSKVKQERFVSSWLKQFKQQPATLETIGPNSRLRLYDHLLTCGKEKAAS